MALRPDEQVSLQGKMHPLYKGVLREAIDNGIVELSVRLIQAPNQENGGMAICSAKAVFPPLLPDGTPRVFEEIGDCDGTNCGVKIAPHRIRMAATRAKGRALRDALGIGEALAEEMSDLSPRSEEPVAAPIPAARPAAVASGELTCSAPGCGKPLTKGQHDVSVRSYGQPLCPACQKQHTRA